MTESARQSADDLHPEISPKFHRRFVARNNEIKLHRAKTEPSRFGKTMFPHCAAGPLPASALCNNECGIRDVRAAAGLVGMQSVASDDLALLLSNENVRIPLKPVSLRLITRNVRFEWVGLARRDHLFKNLPDCIAI